MAEWIIYIYLFLILWDRPTSLGTLPYNAFSQVDQRSSTIIFGLYFFSSYVQHMPYNQNTILNTLYSCSLIVFLSLVPSDLRKLNFIGAWPRVQNRTLSPSRAAIILGQILVVYLFEHCDSNSVV